MKLSFTWVLLALAVPVSCAKFHIGGDKSDSAQAEPFGPTGIPPALRAKPPLAGTPVVAGGNNPASRNGMILTPEEDIVFTDPDSGDANLPELSSLLAANPKHRGPWEQSESLAKQRAAREGKPLLIWFTDSARSPLCKALNDELFALPEFEKWASEKIIRLRVDASVKVDDPDLSLDDKETRRIDLTSYTSRLRKQYKVLGQPTLVLLNPGGEVLGTYRGYKRGQGAFYWGLIKQGEAASSSTYQKWRAGLEKTGYREWQDRGDNKVLAKLTRYADGTLTLIQPDGTRCRTQESKLSDKDRAWIAEQKKLRNIQ